MSKTFNMVGGGGANVIANPALTGTEIDLQGLEVNGTKYKVPLIRPNLLNNWYFVGGGSQQGGGQFPVNQMGQTVYTAGASYAIDRWTAYATANQYRFEILSDCIEISTVANWHRIQQFVPSCKGKTVTFSCLFKGGDSGRIALWRHSSNAGIGSTYWDGSPTDWTLVTITATIPSDEEIIECRIIPTATGNAASVKVKAVKLELGSAQTLAHNEGTEENPVWVLNEIPNYTEELWKCQRYYQLFASSSYRPTYGEDYRPPMRLHSPTKGTISIGGTTYYYADANL